MLAAACRVRRAVPTVRQLACTAVIARVPVVRAVPRAPATFGSIRFQSTNNFAGKPVTLFGKEYPADGNTNTPPSIQAKVGRNLHLQKDHPLATLREIIETHFAGFQRIQPESPVVTVFQNFDELGFAPDHPGRSLTDSYYLNKEHMLRTHTSAHEVEAYKTGADAFLIAADVYRRDEIDSSHYPVFHQMEGMRHWDVTDVKQLTEQLHEENARLAAELAACPIEITDISTIGAENPLQECHDPALATEMAQNLKHSLNGMIFKLFGHITADGQPLKVRWIDAFFPWTSPSFEVEVWYNDEWLEILGCGVVVQKTLERGGVGHKSGWAFGLGLERIAMVLFDIPDIRLFWSQDERFLSQFKQGQITAFQPYSKYPPCYKDMSFWLPEAGTEGIKAWHENDYCEVVRDVAGDLVENVTLIDDFTHPKTGRRSLCYRLNYRSMDRSLTNAEANALQDKVEGRVVEEMGIELR